MNKSRFILLVAIGMSSWGLGNPVVPMPVALAQSPTPTVTVATYDRLMKAGYEATARKNYPVAIENFRQALRERPNDPAAQSAIANAEKSLGRSPAQANPPALDPNTLPWPLIAGSALLTIALAGALASVVSRSAPSRKYPKKKAKARVRPLGEENQNRSFEENGTPKSETNNFGDLRDDDPERDSLPVQSTSRIPNVDLVLRLIDNLRDEDPRVRRRAIWRLAQMSDSRSMQPLVDGMIDGDSYERSLTLEALAQICTRVLRPMNQALAVSLEDKNPQVRKNAIRDLTRLYDVMSQISQLIIYKANNDPDDEVKETASWAMRQLNLQLPPKLEIGPLETTGEPEEEVPETPYTETTEVQN
ncbi:HEAT repeat domain-containing protein [Pannus brasiliensis CCIBt3594]|uniref:HEAT repeat domain-containing protein n=1 Tax=Pannus brasiliensis CCIBt3594 TaxID=1427578 RepID=A0AAW9QTJ8_9CHRO